MSALAGVAVLPQGIIFPGTISFFQVNSPVLPGQPVTFTWAVNSTDPNFNPGLVTAVVSVAGQVIYTRTLSYSPPNPPARPVGATGETATVQLSPSQPGAGALYRIGTNGLRLDLTASGDYGPEQLNDGLLVQPEPIDATWWTYLSPPPPPPIASVRWKEQSYSVGGLFTNKGSLALTPIAIVLSEADGATGNAVTRTVSPTPGTVPPGAEVTANWSGITQSWQWIVPGIWAMQGPLNDAFIYTVIFSLTDPYGNAYNFDSASIQVNVSVSQVKQSAGIAAYSLQAAAINAALIGAALAAGILTGAAAAIFFGIAAGLESSAALSGTAATDPPLPDFDFGQPVPAPDLTLIPQVSALLPNLPATRSVIAVAARIFALQETLGKIYSKLLGARIAGDPAALQTWTAQHQDATQRLSVAASALGPASGEAASELSAQVNVPPGVLETILNQWRSDGIPKQVLEDWAALGLPIAALDAIDAAIRAGVGPTESSSASILGVAQAAEGFANAAQAEASETLSVLL